MLKIIEHSGPERKYPEYFRRRDRRKMWEENVTLHGVKIK